MAELRIGIAAKKSYLDYLCWKKDLTWDQAMGFAASTGKNVDNLISSHNRQKHCFESVVNLCPQAKTFDLYAVEDGKAQKPELDLVLSVGGDNFFQWLGHYYPDAYLVGVNSDTQTSHGGILHYDLEKLVRSIDGIVRGDFRTERWTKIASYLNGQRLDDALCVASITPSPGYMSCTYLLKTRYGDEVQKGSGLIVATGAGSGKRAWYNNAGPLLTTFHSGLYLKEERAFPFDSDILKTMSLIPMDAEDCPYKLANVTIRPGEELSVVYWASVPGDLSMDSVEKSSYVINDGDVIRFCKSEKALKVVARD